MRTYDEILAAMEDRYEELSGYAAGGLSDTGIRMRVLASQVYSLYTDAGWLLRQMFMQTAAGEYLDMHAATRGLVRKTAAPAAGQLRLYLAAPLWYDIEIPPGTVASTPGQDAVRFQTVETAVIKAGETEALCDAQAEEGGVAGNVAAGDITLLINPPQSVVEVVNPEAFSGGGDGESDEDLRQRLVAACMAQSNGTNSAYYQKEAMQYSGVSSVQVVPRANGRGTLDIYVAGYGGVPSDELIAEMTEDFSLKKEINVDIRVLPATLSPVNFEIQLVCEDGYTMEEATENVREAMTSFFNELQIAEAVVLAKLGSVIFQTEGVKNYRFVTPSADVYGLTKTLRTMGSLTVRSWG